MSIFIMFGLISYQFRHKGGYNAQEDTSLRFDKKTYVINGFSLFELLAVLIIVGILVTIAYPGYRDYITRAHRSDGQTALFDLARRMEHYFSKHNTYQRATIGTGK